jgi:hypothetical protein
MMKKIFSILFALVLVVSLGLVMSTPVLASTIRYVPSVYPTIQAAINASSAGDTIMVAAGNYSAFVVQGKQNISIIGAEGATVTTANSIEALPLVEPTWFMAAVFDSQNINIEGINFNGAGVNGKHMLMGIAYFDSTGRIADLTVANITGTETGGGVAIMSASTVEIKGATISTTISNNNSVGIYVCCNSTLEIHFNNIVGNSLYGVLNEGGGMVDATYNWWGAASGPLHPIANPGGTGNAVSDNVNFKPWLGAGVVTKTVTDGIFDAIAEADTEVVVKGKATVTIAKYASNPHPLSGGGAPTSLDLLALDTFSELNIFRDVCAINTAPGTEIEIRLYYTDAEVEGFNETSLRLFWWNNTAWVQCSPDADSGVTTTDVTIDNHRYSGYMWSKIRADTTPSLDNLRGTEFGGYGHPSAVPQPCGCFIATVAYGTDTAKELDILREFRDVVLLPNSLGAKLVSLYYKTSPPIAHFISQHEVLRTVVRVGFVDPIVKILNWSHDLWSVRSC